MTRSRFIILLLTASTGFVRAAPVRDTFAEPRPTPTIERFLGRDDKGPARYRALRRMDASNAHFGASAWMDAWTENDEDGQFRFEVAAEGGSGYIRKKVFLAALEGERKMQRDGDPKRAQLDLTNYAFADEGLAGGLMKLAIKPHRKDVLLVDGWVYAGPDDGDLMRIEGRLSKNPSFWTRRVEIVRRYGRVGGAHVPLEIESVAQIFIAGRSTFRMIYDYETINGRRVGSPKPRQPEKPSGGREP